MGFEALYLAHWQTVYQFLLFRLNDTELAEDLLQETFLAAHQSSNALSQLNSPRAWLLAIAHNKMVDYLRKDQPKIQEYPVEQLGTPGEQSLTNLLLGEALAQLLEPERTILFGLYALGLSYRELAEILKLPVGSVKSKAHYARKRLRIWLEEESG